jgi:hypothetical protein
MIDCSKTENYFAEKRRMTKRAKNGRCQLSCSNCPLCGTNNNKGLLCTDFEVLYPKEAVKAVQEWSNANPQRTYLTEFLEHYPNTKLNDAGTPKGICPYHLGLMNKDDCRKDHYCVKCWNQPISIEDGEK